MRSCWLFPEPEPGLPSFDILIYFMMMLPTSVMTMVMIMVITMVMNQMMLTFVSSRQFERMQDLWRTLSCEWQKDFVNKCGFHTKYVQLILEDGTQFDFESQKDAGIVRKVFCENNDDRWLYI